MDWKIRGSLMSAAILMAGPAFAQDSTSAETDGASGLADIVVTATRRSENLQDVPISIAAVTGEQLSSSGVATTRGLEQVVPGLVVAQTAVAVQPTLRGIGTRGSGPGDESNVAMYIDGVYQPAMASNIFELLNIERVEVLKGPQGTLFGRNATGGAINVITTKPGADAVARIMLEYGRYNQIKAGTYLATPISDTLSADLTAQYSYADGYIDNLAGDKLGAHRSHTLRGRVRWQPTEAVDIIAAVSHIKVEDNSAFATQPVNGNSIGRRLNPAVQLPTRVRQFVGDVRPETGFSQFDANLQISIDLGGVSLQSTSDYQENTSNFASDSDSTSFNRGTQASPDNYMDAWSQEIRLVSEGSGRFKWVLGGMAFGSDAALNPLFSVTGTNVTTIRGRQKTRAYAGFGEATWEPVDGLFLTGGLRYSWEKKTYFPFVNVATPQTEKSFSSWTPRASVRYEFMPDASAYFTYSKGFKSGLFNATSSQRFPVEPEKITSYEIGLKTQPLPWLRANFAAFIYDYTNLQVQARDVNSASVIFQNAGAAKVKGFDAEIALAPAEGLTINLAAAYLHSRYTDFKLAQITVPTRLNGVAIGGNDQIIADVTGRELIRAPEWTLTAGFNYKLDLGSGSLRLGANANYNDGYWLEVGNRLRQPSYVLVNANIGWWTEDERLGVTLWGENLTAEDVVLYPIISGNGDLFSYRKPATYGIRLNGKF